MGAARRWMPWVLALGSLGLGVGAVAWLLGERDPAGARPTAPAQAAPPAAREEPAPLPREPDPSPAAAAPGQGERAPLEAAPTPEPQGAIALTLLFVDPVRQALEVPAGTLRATWPEGERTLALRGEWRVTLEGLPAGEVTVAVDAAGLRHVPQSFTLRNGTDETEERVFLWPSGWVAVVVRGEDGAPFTELALARDVEPKRLFVGAFGARTRRAPPTPGDDAPDPEPPSRFEEPRSWQAFELPGSTVGALRRLDPGPHWVGLEVYGVPLAWEHLPPGAETIEFTLTEADLEARLAALSLRVVDPSGAPLAGAHATLKADTSAHRREDQMRVASDADGRVEFARVVPGEYELLVEGAWAMSQERLLLAPGERREQGDVVLADGRPLTLRVVDEHGNPALAWIEVAPLQAFGRARDLYPPNLHRHTAGDGRYELPLPSTPSMLRARRMDPATGHPSSERSTNVAVDPARPPGGEVVLVVTGSREVTVTTTDARAARVALVDALEVVVDDRSVAVDHPARLEVPPGSYRALLLDADGAELAARDVEVREDVTLPLP